MHRPIRSVTRLWSLGVMLSVALALSAWSPRAYAQSGDGALLYCGSNGFCDFSFTQLRQAFLAAGADALEQSDTLNDLTPYRMIVVMVPRAGLEESVRDELRGFHATGGSLVLVSERESFQRDATEGINALLSELNNPIRLTNDDLGASCGQAATTLGVDALMQAVTRISYANAGLVSTGGLLLASDGSVELMRVADRVLVASDSNIFSDECLDSSQVPFVASGNLQFFFNLWLWASPDIDNDGTLNADDNCPSLANRDQADLDDDGEGDLCDDDVDGDAVLNVNDNCVRTPNANQNNADLFLTTAEAIPFNMRPAPALSVELGDDAFSDPVALGFDFDFFGQSYGELRVSSNGFVTFDSPRNSAPDGRAIPSADIVNNLIAGYWDDLDPNDGGRILVGARGQAPDREFIVFFDEIQHAPNGTPVSFQIVLAEQGERVEVHCQECPEDGDAHTQGVENDDGRYGGFLPGRNFRRFSLREDGVAFTISAGDELGDACDEDADNDTIVNGADNCPLNANFDQADFDGDDLGDACDPDDDDDNVLDQSDNCLRLANFDQANADNDEFGDLCDDDDDNDTVLDADDNCPLNANLDQADFDGDDLGDACDLDDDDDGVLDADDNCPLDANADQANNDMDGEGDLCDLDDDNDGVPDVDDNCPLIANPGQEDLDEDDLGDLCDGDRDDDAIDDNADNCPDDPNPDQADLDDDELGDACDEDADGDTVLNDDDNCPRTANPGQEDLDMDGVGDACADDRDGDGVLDDEDNCPLDANADQRDADEDGQGDRCDEDDDNDTVPDGADNCPEDANIDQADLDMDGEGDACDDDDDGDGVDDDEDNCPRLNTIDQSDTDGDGEGDACDEDDDNDNVLDDEDNCPFDANTNQANNDRDPEGDVCDDDDDDDTVLDDEDNCPFDVNTDQADVDMDGVGDVCDESVEPQEPEPQEPEPQEPEGDEALVFTVQGGACAQARPTRAPGERAPLIGLSLLLGVAWLRRRRP